MLTKTIGVQDDYVEITTVISRTVDEVTIEYGIDLTPLLMQQEPARYRRLQRIAEQSHLDRMASASTSSDQTPLIPNRHRRAAAIQSRRTERRLQAANETTDAEAEPTFDYFWW